MLRWLPAPPCRVMLAALVVPLLVACGGAPAAGKPAPSPAPAAASQPAAGWPGQAAPASQAPIPLRLSIVSPSAAYAPI